MIIERISSFKIVAMAAAIFCDARFAEDPAAPGWQAQ